MSISFQSEIRDRFSELKTELEKEYGFGFSPNRDKMAKIIDSALELTTDSPEVSQEEYDFYKSASVKVVASEGGFNELNDTVDAIATVMDVFELTEKEIQAQFLAKNDFQRAEYLTSDAYHSIVRQANEDTVTIGETAKKIQDLLFKAEKDAKTNPFKDLATFAEHRQAVSELYNKVADLGNRQASAVAALSAESLYASDSFGKKVKRSLSAHKCALSLAGAAIAAGSAYGVSKIIS